MNHTQVRYVGLYCREMYILFNPLNSIPFCLEFCQAEGTLRLASLVIQSCTSPIYLSKRPPLKYTFFMRRPAGLCTTVAPLLAKFLACPFQSAPSLDCLLQDSRLVWWQVEATGLVVRLPEARVRHLISLMPLCDFDYSPSMGT